MSQLKRATIELHKEETQFAAGHFTVFSATERERFHGHSYSVYLALSTLIGEEGIAFDYRIYKEKLRAITENLNLSFMLPRFSPHLKIIESENHYEVLFNKEKLLFLKSDVEILPIANTTIEEMACYFLARLIEDKETLSKHKIQEITLKVYAGTGKSGVAKWQAE